MSTNYDNCIGRFEQLIAAFYLFPEVVIFWPKNWYGDQFPAKADYNFYLKTAQVFSSEL